MASRRGATPPPIEIRQFTVPEIDSGIEKLRRRIREVDGLEQDSVRFDDARVQTAETNIRESIREVFGTTSPEFNHHQYHDIWHGGYNALDDDPERQRKFLLGVIDTR